MFDDDTRTKKESALRTILETMGIPEARLDTARTANLRWLVRNLQINHRDHPLFESAWEMSRQLLQNTVRLSSRRGVVGEPDASSSM